MEEKIGSESRRLDAAELDWQFKSGRDRDGDKFSNHILVHASGRILADIKEPTEDEYDYQVEFRCGVPSKILNQCDGFMFIDVDSAKRFAVDILTQFDPFGPGERDVED